MAYIIKNAQLVSSEGILSADVLVVNDKIERIAPQIENANNAKEINAEGKFLFAGAIDDQVHFREPGLTHKGNIKSESLAALAGGITSFMEMPNTNPQSLTQELLQAKYDIAAANSPVNYSFFMGASNENLEEVLKTDPKKVCGVKVFMGSSTGNMLVDNREVLTNLFSQWPHLIATHCEEESVVRRNLEIAKQQFGDNIPFEQHPIIRSHEACYESSSKAVALAKETGARLHILHISTAKELSLFEAGPVENKKITAEACIHHLWFSDADYATKGSLIKWNPAVKTASDREAIRAAVKNDVIDVLATDHAPHTFEEKSGNYMTAPSGGPLVQHAFMAALDLVEQGVFTYSEVAKKMSEAPAKLFRIGDRGFLKEGMKADLVLINKNKYTVTKDNLLYKCGWSPFEGHTFSHSIEKTWVNGKLMWDGTLVNDAKGERLTFDV